MEKNITDSVRVLRRELHGLAELSGEEKKTKEFLWDYLSKNTSLLLEDSGQWFCAVHKEDDAASTVAFRADMDALPLGNGYAHLCGHDGHAAILAGLGLWLEHKKIGRNIVLIFQHSEENGKGGKVCCQALKKYKADRVYAFHNIPGWKEGAVLLRHGTFACASRGMILKFTGSPSHAAYPENGRNPGFAASRFIAALPEMTASGCYRGLAMATLIGAKIGEKAFGSAAGNAEVWLTLRAWHEDDLKSLIAKTEERAEKEAARDAIKTDFSFVDVFPATENDENTLEGLAGICRRIGLECIEVPEPFRWSEDFGYYASYAPAVMVGIGDGNDWPQLHTENYGFNDAIISAALDLFSSLAQFG